MTDSQNQKTTNGLLIVIHQQLKKRIAYHPFCVSTGRREVAVSSDN